MIIFIVPRHYALLSLSAHNIFNFLQGQTTICNGWILSNTWISGCFAVTETILIRIHSPGEGNVEHYHNRKSYFSINGQVISDHNLLIRDGLTVTVK